MDICVFIYVNIFIMNCTVLYNPSETNPALKRLRESLKKYHHNYREYPLTQISQIESVITGLNRSSREGEVLIVPNELYSDKTRRHNKVGAAFVKKIRLNPKLGGEDNLIQKSFVIVYSSIPLIDFLRLEPRHTILLSEGVEYIDLLDSGIEQMLNVLKNASSIKDKDLDSLPEYLSGMSGLPDGSTRHSAASVFSVHVMLKMATSIHELSSSTSGELKGKAQKYILFYDPPEVQVDDWLEESLFIYGRKMEGFKKINDEIDTLIKLVERIKLNVSIVSGETRKIGLIDDEALRLSAGKKPDLGWYKAFKTILFDNEGIVDNFFDTYPEFPIEHITESHLDEIVEMVGKAKYSCLLLDAHLNTIHEADGIEHKLGTKLLEKLRTVYPTLPIIIITATNKAWKHRILTDKGADAVWVKEGLDERRSPERSYYNLYRILELISRVSGEEYQFLRRFGEAVEKIKNDKGSLWWNKGKISWTHKGPYPRDKRNFEESQVDHRKLQERISKLLEDGMELLRSYLYDVIINFNEASGGKGGHSDSFNGNVEKERQRVLRTNMIAKSMIMQLAKVIELIHGQKEMNTSHGDRINAFIMGGGKERSKKKRNDNKSNLTIVRGDWIAYFLFQQRNECAHYFEKVNYQFSSSANGERSLIEFISSLLAYLFCKYQPYHSQDSKDFYLTKPKRGENCKVNFAYINDPENGLLVRKKDLREIKEYAKHYKWLREGS